jgi:hypothetical protein
MEDFLQMNIFFATTTSVVLLLGVLLSIVLYYLIKILRSIEHITANVSEESDSLRGDLHVLRGKIRDEGMKIKHFMDFFGGMATRSRGRSTKKKATE